MLHTREKFSLEFHYTLPHRNGNVIGVGDAPITFQAQSEDEILRRPDCGLYGVADGYSISHDGRGLFASRIAMSVANDILDGHLDWCLNVWAKRGFSQQTIHELILLRFQEVAAKAHGHIEALRGKISSSISLFKIFGDNGKNAMMSYGSIGACPMYYYRPSTKHLMRLTKVYKGKAPALGKESHVPTMQYGSMPIRSRDIICILSAGAAKHISEKELKILLSKRRDERGLERDIQEWIGDRVQKKKKSSGIDDISAVVYRHR